VAVRGRFAVLLFEDTGHITTAVQPFGVGRGALAAELAPGVWHTVFAVTAQSVLFEIKVGPFDPRCGQWNWPPGRPKKAAWMRALIERLSAAALSRC
jgi:cupin fold WbuC family metalloprotein